VSEVPQEKSKNHHYVPQHMLRDFCAGDGWMTVVSVRPVPEVETRQAPTPGRRDSETELVGAPRWDLRRSARAALSNTFDLPGMVSLAPPRNRHQAILPELILQATAAIGAAHVVAVRRTTHPMLTGSEPVVVFPTWDLIEGVSCAELLRTADPPIPLWEERDELLQRVGDRLRETAGGRLPPTATRSS
jgi:hypothetical protein